MILYRHLSYVNAIILSDLELEVGNLFAELWRNESFSLN